MDNLNIDRLKEAFLSLKPQAIQLLSELVKIPSENNPPYGDEKKVQEFYHAWLRKNGLESFICYPHEIPSFASHPARLAEHDMTDRPDVVATIPGTGKGKSLLLLAHADVVPAGPPGDWKMPQYSGEICDGCLWGRGSGDDKCGMAIAAFVPLILRKAGISLEGNLTVAAVADEEAGGGNGVAALLAKGFSADAAIYLDGSNQTIWDAGLGGGFAELVLSAASASELKKLEEQKTQRIRDIKNEIMRKITGHPDFGESFFQKTMAGFFNIIKDRTNDTSVKLTFLLDTLPGDDEENLKAYVESKLSENGKFKINWMSRFLKPSPKLPDSHPLISEMKKSFEIATGRKGQTAPGRQGDQGLVSFYGHMPCVLFGCGRLGKEGAPHLPDEHILLKDFEENLLTISIMAANWCGVKRLI